MSFSFSIPSKSKPQLSTRPKKPDTSTTTKNFVTEFNPNEAPKSPDSKIKPIAPIPNHWRPTKKLKNLPNLPQLSENGDNSLQFELDPGSNPEAVDNSMSYGLNLRQQPSENGSGRDRGETVSEMELRKLREDLEKLPEDTGVDEFEDVPVEGFGAAILSGYGWKEGRGIGRNAKEDVKVSEVIRKAGRGGLGFTEELPEPVRGGGGNGDSGRSGDVSQRKDKVEERKESKGFGVGKEVMVVNGREMGVKGKIVEVRSGGDLLVLRVSRSDEKVKVRARDVAEVGSAEEEKCLRKLKELKIKEKEVREDGRDRNSSRKRGQEEVKPAAARVNWLRNHIRVRIVSEELKGGTLYLKKGVVVDVVGPGMCDISVDESRGLIQGVDQELLETALPKRGGPVLVLYGRHKGVYGSLLERDSQSETGVVRDADTHELLHVKLEQIAEYTGDPSDIGY